MTGYNNQIPLLRLSQNCLLEKSKKFYELLSIVIVVVKIKTEKYFRQRGEGGKNGIDQLGV